MIKIKEVYRKEQNKYSVIYQIDHKAYMITGDSKDILEDLLKTNRETQKKIND